MSSNSHCNRSSLAAAACLALAGVAALAPAARAENIVATLNGSWSGSGRIVYTDGSSEGIHCNAFYTGSGRDLSMAIQCKSDRNPIHIRSKLRIDGSRASGEWEERTFNASGNASGNVGPNSMSLKVSGGGFDGQMAVSFNKSQHDITVTTKGIAMSRATMSLSRK